MKEKRETNTMFDRKTKLIYWKIQWKKLENPGIDPGTSHMRSERSTIWANSPYIKYLYSNTN